jgi:hypothetical protein
MLHGGFLADTPYKCLLLQATHKDLCSLDAVYFSCALSSFTKPQRTFNCFAKA